MISASLVIYNNPAEMLLRVIRSFAPSAERRLYLIDNSPERCVLPDEVAGAEGVFYEFTGKNLGYGRAHNRGIEYAIRDGSEFHTVLNPDLAFDPSVIDVLADYARTHQDIVALMPRIEYPDGSLQYLCKLLPTPADLVFRRFFPEIGPFRRANDRYTLKSSGYDKVINPPCLSGCFMFLRVETLQKEAFRFDERFFMYCEDFDLVRRLHRVGRTVFYPDVTVIHDHARESYHNRKMLMLHIRSVCTYFCKYGWFFDSERRRMNRETIKEIKTAQSR